MTLAAIVVTFNSEVCIDPLLDSVAQAGVDEIVVVDNGSTDATVARVQQHEGVRLVRSMNVGYAGGINQGVRAAPEAHAYLVLNPDLVIEPGAAEALAAALEEPGVGITVPVVLTSDGRRQDSLRREPTLLRAIGLNGTGVPLFSEYVTGDDAYSRPRDVDWALGAAVMFSRGCYEAVGPWDESFFLYSEETDFCLRARDAGWRTRFVPRAVVVHHEGGSGRSDATHQMLILNKVRLYARRHGRIAAWAYWVATILSEATWVLRGHPESRAAIRALMRPAERPPELRMDKGIFPQVF
jgi:N-acetylglucosaminyl-diphospho-decaprenol L-rhamnosyltransferase